MARTVADSLALKEPYPGLRPFRPSESCLFFGRETQVQELLDRLPRQRFLGVVGVSGCGKSSLVLAGLIPALERGGLSGSSARWRIARLRPGNAPIRRLEAALQRAELQVDGLAQLLNSSSMGLVEVAKAGLAANENLLLLVDQFEEIFRFRENSMPADGGEEASRFVSALLQAAAASLPAIFVVITMRTDHFGDCSQFTGLTEALNRGQFLVPRLTRDELQAAIERPLDLFDLEPSRQLVQRVLADIGDSADLLPVVQHALNRTFHQLEATARANEAAPAPRKNERGQLWLAHYERAGTIVNALANHANEICTTKLAGTDPWVERVFRCLTVLDNGRMVRRPTTLRKIWGIANAADASTRETVKKVIRAFAAPDESLLSLGDDAESAIDVETVALADDTLVDIPHESLITRWGELTRWTRNEGRAVDRYLDAAADAAENARDEARPPSWRRRIFGSPRLWRGPKLAAATELLPLVWNGDWAERVAKTPRWAAIASDTGHAITHREVTAFLERSATLERRRTYARRLLIAVVAVGLAGYGGYQLTQERMANSLTADAVEAGASLDKAAAALEQKQQEARALEEWTSLLEARQQKTVTNAGDQARENQAIRDELVRLASAKATFDSEKQQAADTLRAERAKVSSLAQQAANLGSGYSQTLQALETLKANATKRENDLKTQLDEREATIRERDNTIRLLVEQSQKARLTSIVGTIVPSLRVLQKSSFTLTTPLLRDIAITVGDVDNDKTYTAVSSASAAKAVPLRASDPEQIEDALRGQCHVGGWLTTASKQKPTQGITSTLAFGYRGTAYVLHVIDIESVLGRNNIVFDVDATGPTTVGDCISAVATSSKPTSQ